MAMRAIEWMRPSDLRHLLTVRPGRLAYGLRLAVICALTCLVAELYQTPDIALTIYITFFLNQKNRPASLIMNAAFLALITIVVGILIGLSTLVLDNPMWRVASMAAISFGCLFLASASKLRPVGGTLALVIAYALDLLGLVPMGELATRALLYAWLFVGIPAGVSIVVNLIIAPAPGRVLERELGWRLRLSAAMLSGASDEERRQFRDALHEGAAPLLALLKLGQLEHSLGADDSAVWRRAVFSTIAVLSAADVATRFDAVSLSILDAQNIAAALRDVAERLEAGTPPSAPLFFSAGTTSTVSETPVMMELRHCLAQFGTPQAALVTDKGKKQGFWASDAFTNPSHIRYAVKTTAAAMFCYVLYMLIDWPGIHTCFITCYIVSLSTAGESVEKLTLRILGCLLGAAAGFAAILFLLPHLTSIGALMAVVFAGAAVAGYVAAGSPRIAYAGFQIAFAFFLCVVQGPSPAFDFIVARDRVVGILLGNVVSYLVFANIWPVSVTQRIDAAIAKLLAQLSALAKVADEDDRRAAASQLQEALGSAASNLHLARYEPRILRRSSAWIAVRQEAVDAIAGLGGLLLVAGQAAPALAGRIERLDSAAAAGEAPQGASGSVLGSLIDGEFLRLEKALRNFSNTDERIPRHATA